jgi:acetyl esterase
MPLDPQAQKLLELARNAGLPPISQVPITEARARMAKALTYAGEPEPLANVEDLSIAGPGGPMALRHYRPSLGNELPCVVFFHGGGWVLNDLNTHDHLCRALANQSGCAIIAVDYRLAPEHPYPAAVDDVWAATNWVSANARQIGVDPNRLAVAGDSSGATLAAIVSRIACEASGPKLICQALIYPVMDHWTSDTNSYREAGVGFSLSRELMIWFWENYLPTSANLSDPNICPLRATQFQGLPVTLVLTAEFDPLRDEGEEYARRLSESGTPVTCSRYQGMMHGFVIQYGVLDKGRLGLTEISAFLRQHLFSSL